MDRGAWRDCSPWGRKESDTTERLSTHTAHEALIYRAFSTLRILSSGHCQLLMTGHGLLIFKALGSFVELLKPPLHCTFVSSSWAKCIVDVVSCLCSFMKHFEL